jgi:hypothetical protein
MFMGRFIFVILLANASFGGLEGEALQVSSYRALFCQQIWQKAHDKMVSSGTCGPRPTGE